MVRMYVPERGDLVWVNFDPQAGREQAKIRPALVLSPLIYNKPSELFIVCPITSRIKGYPYEVMIPEDCEIQGVILADQIRNMDWKARNAEFIDKIPEEVLEQVLLKLETLIR